MLRCSLLLVVLASCGGVSKPPAGGIASNCDFRVGDACYATSAEACAALDCPMDRCLGSLGLPAQVQCQDAPESGTDDSETGRTQECHPGNCGPEPGMPNALCPDGKTMSGPSGRCMHDPIAKDCGWEIISCP